MNIEGARLCFYLALKKLNEGDIDLAIHRAEEAIKLLKELKTGRNRKASSLQ